MQLSVVIPAYNEEKRIVSTVEAVTHYLQNQDITYEILLVNDGSFDTTASVIDMIARENEHCHALHLEKNMGKGAAVREGMLSSRGELCLFTDADNATPIEELEKFWPHIKADHDIIIGSRNIAHSERIVDQPWYRVSLGKMGNVAIRNVLGQEIRDTQCGFKCFRRKHIPHLFSKQTIHGWGFDFEILAIANMHGLSIVEVPINWFHQEGSRVRPIKGAIGTLRELIKVKVNMMKGVYSN